MQQNNCPQLRRSKQHLKNNKQMMTKQTNHDKNYEYQNQATIANNITNNDEDNQNNNSHRPHRKKVSLDSINFDSQYTCIFRNQADSTVLPQYEKVICLLDCSEIDQSTRKRRNKRHQKQLQRNNTTS